MLLQSKDRLIENVQNALHNGFWTINKPKHPNRGCAFLQLRVQSI